MAIYIARQLLGYEAPNNSSDDSSRITKNGRDDDAESTTSNLATLVNLANPGPVCLQVVVLVVALHGASEAGYLSLDLPHFLLIQVEIHSLPALHKHLLHTRDMQIVVFTLRPVRPPQTFETTTMATACYLNAEKEAPVTVLKARG